MDIQILIVEDDKTQNDVLANFLKYENYKVYSAYSILEAREYMKQDIHLVILDVMLPDGNGLAFLKEIRKTTSVPVIVLTALDDEYTQMQSFDLKADEYVDKPVSPVVMTKRVKALVERIYGNSSIVKINGFLFDFERFVITAENGEEVKLTTKEIQIVKLLYDYHGKVVTRDMILDFVWGNEYVGEDRLIDTHIKNIRKKLGNKIIVTVKGVGYRLQGFI
jgi:DNA-binding response OmpR family regulator